MNLELDSVGPLELDLCYCCGTLGLLYISFLDESTHNFVSTIFNQCTPKFYIVKHYDHEFGL